MRAKVGDRIVLAAVHVDDSTRDGEIIAVQGKDGAPPYEVRWSDGHVGVIYPGPGAVLRIGDHGAGGQQPAADKPKAPHQAATEGGAASAHVREWQVRVSIFESDDDTSASVVLLSDSPLHLKAHGTSHRSSRDPDIPEIGDEIAVARALRHLADQLTETAEKDIEAIEGEPAHIRPL